MYSYVVTNEFVPGRGHKVNRVDAIRNSIVLVAGEFIWGCGRDEALSYAKAQQVAKSVNSVLESKYARSIR